MAKGKYVRESSGPKGAVSLIFALIAVGLLVAAVIPMENIRDTGIRFSGWINVAFAGGAFVSALIAIILAATAKAGGKRPGSAKAGLVFGILSLILSLLISAGTCMVVLISDYANNGEDSFLGTNIKDNPDLKSQIDDLLDKILGEDRS